MLAHAFAELLLLPPVNLLLLAIAGAALPRRWRRGGRILTATGLAGLLLLALPVVPRLLLYGLERAVPPPPADAPPPGAVVILSGDATRVAGTPEHLDVGPLTLERLRSGAVAARATGLPVLVTGGPFMPGSESLAALMATSLDRDFGVPVRWTETAARDTWENARLSAAMLRAAGISSVLLVTNGWHMPRALIAFRRFGLAAVPAPTPLSTARLQARWQDFVPRATAWTYSYYALHEWIGLLWYGLRARAGD
jgi:uncharacterized SAM-binding protein YcdF (DUF218 family)